MLAKIKFVSSSKSNILSVSDVSYLENYLGEPLKVDRMKRDEDGNLTTFSWRDTDDVEKVEKDSNYTLVEDTGYRIINSSDWYIVDLQKFMIDYPNIEYSMKGLPKAASSDHGNLIAQMQVMADKIEDAKNRFNESVEFNQKCDVHVPNLGLMSINRLGYANDYCTEQLQELLYKGWRILAVCPQPDQRRPDYILGMNVAELDGNVKVTHFESNK